LKTTNNSEILIKARNEKDYEQSMLIAKEIEESTNKAVVICPEDPFELWIELTTHWDNFNAKMVKDEYDLAKAKIKALK
jgi:hypothetical protein